MRRRLLATAAFAVSPHEIRPNKNFGHDGWGAFEVAARISRIDLPDSTVKA